MKTRRDFLKKTALFGASAFMPPSLLGQESDGNCSFSRETTSSMLVPMGDALKITGTFLGTFIKYYKISQLIHTQIIAN